MYTNYVSGIELSSDDRIVCGGMIEQCMNDYNNIVYFSSGA